jgi:signal transduction histidine kinase
MRTRERNTRLVLGLAFAGIAAMLGAALVVTYIQWREVAANIQLIEDDSLESVRLLGRMDHDVLEQRMLVDRHIFEHAPLGLTALERRLAAVHEDFRSAAQRYDALTSAPGEAEAWQLLRNDLESLEPKLARALELSRENRTSEAQTLIATLEPTYDAIDRDVGNLTDINERSAVEGNERVARLERSVVGLWLVLALAVIVITAVTGMWVTRRIARGERALERQAAELENRNRELDAFAGRVAHDLRGPLNTVSLAAAVLDERRPDDLASTAILKRGVKQMIDLVEELLQLSRAGSHVVAAVGRTEPIGTSLEHDLGPVVREAGGTLRVELEPASVKCSEGLLRQALWNLGENAVKYRKPDVAPHIEVVGHRGPGGYDVRVTDNGPGMSREETEHVFEPFFRGAAGRRTSGTGLGLSIVRRVIESCGGAISVESEVGRGTTFAIHLPLAPPESASSSTSRPPREDSPRRDGDSRADSP